MNRLIPLLILLIVIIGIAAPALAAITSVSTSAGTYAVGSTVTIYVKGDEGTEVAVQVVDPNGKIVYIDSGVIGPTGVAEFSFTLRADAAIGEYIVYASDDLGNTVYTSFTVSESSGGSLPSPPPLIGGGYFLGIPLAWWPWLIVGYLVVGFLVALKVYHEEAKSAAEAIVSGLLWIPVCVFKIIAYVIQKIAKSLRDVTRKLK